MNILTYVSLAIWDIPEGWRWACYYLVGFGGGLSGLCIACGSLLVHQLIEDPADILVRWAHEICTDNNEERAIVVASMNEMAYVLQVWLPLIVWQQIDAPQYRKGFITVACLSFLLIVNAFLVRFLHQRQKQQQASSLPRMSSSS